MYTLVVAVFNVLTGYFLFLKNYNPLALCSKLGECTTRYKLIE